MPEIDFDPRYVADNVGEAKDTIEDLLVFTYRFMAFNAITLFSRANEREAHFRSETNRLYDLYTVANGEKEKIQEDRERLRQENERLEAECNNYKLQLENPTKKNSFMAAFFEK